MSLPGARSSGAVLRIGVVGAGIAGLAAARELAQRGHAVTVLDKGRGPGGRCSSRRAEPFSFDHGAQYFTAREAGFRREVRRWVEQGAVAPWAGRIVTLGAGAALPAADPEERFVGVPRMSALARHLAADLDLRCGARVEAAERVERGWRLSGAGGTSLGTYDRLLVTAPPAQAAALLGTSSPIAQEAVAIAVRPCWAVLLGLAEPYAAELDGAFCNDAALAWVARDSSKPGRPPAEAWVLHASPEWTEAHLDDEPGRVVELLTGALERLTARALPGVVHVDAHRWLHARPDPVLDVGCLVDLERGVALAGDAYLGGRVEGAWLSGLVAARRLA